MAFRTITEGRKFKIKERKIIITKYNNICKEFLKIIYLEKRDLLISVNTVPAGPEFHKKFLNRANQHLSHKMELML
jgi:hypothetical protein